MTHIERTVLDVFERVAATFVQAFLSALLVTGSVARPSWQDAALIAAFAAVVSLLTTALSYLIGLKSKLLTNPYLDLGYRVVLTFGQTLVGLVGAAGTISALSFDWSTAFKVSAIAAGVALLKGLIGLNNPVSAGASALVARSDGERPRTGSAVA